VKPPYLASDIGDDGTIVHLPAGGDAMERTHYENHEDLTDKLSQTVKPGDLLLFAGGALRDRIIEAVSGRYGHAAIAYHDGDRVMLAQATLEDGVHIKALADEIRDWGGTVDHYVVLSEGHEPPYDATLAIEAARSKVGRTYAWWLIVGIFFYTVTHWSELRPRTRRTTALICSQLVAWAVLRGRVRLVPHVPLAATSPSQLVEGKRTRWVGAFSTPVRDRGRAIASPSSVAAE
jgi:hypothetical protein